MKTDKTSLQLKKSLPVIKAYMPVLPAMPSLVFCMSMKHSRDSNLLAAYSALGNKMSKDNLEYKILRKFASNNWLKMHGYPMRRRRRGR